MRRSFTPAASCVALALALTSILVSSPAAHAAGLRSAMAMRPATCTWTFYTAQATVYNYYPGGTVNGIAYAPGTYG